MCGICGVVSRAPLNQPQRDTVARLNSALIHRGPDGEGVHASTHAHLAMRRLAIIDLQGGWQPLHNEDRTIALVANGEVYNFIELRRDLESRGHRFRTNSDCETIVHAYEEFGDEFVHKLRGMYAFALHDTRRQRLILGRDRMGEKPLYLRERDGEIYFASELRALLAAGVAPFRVDPGAVNLFLHYTYVPEPRTAIEGVRKLPAGHLLVVDLARWSVEQRCYWRLEDAPPIDADPVATVRAELERIAELVTRADVPIGVALSAGVDSSVIALLASRARPGQVHALTVGYPGNPRQDERSAARRWAHELGMPFHDVEVTVREFVELFPERALWRDDPIADTAGHNYFAVSRLARDNGIPVLLQGQGGDELFWGYSWVREAARLTRLKAAGKLGRARALAWRLGRMVPDAPSLYALRACALRNLGVLRGHEPFALDTGGPDALIFYNLALEYQRGAYGVSRILHPEFLARAREANPAEPFTVARPWGDPGALLTALQCRLYLLENGMVQGDRLSMINSVELRLPLSDYRLAEIAVGLRKAAPDDALPPKHRLLSAVRGLLPEWIVNRPKTGFTPPARAWMPALVGGYAHSLRDGYLSSHNIIHSSLASRAGAGTSRTSPWIDLFYRTLVLEFWCRGMCSVSGVSMSHTHRVPSVA